MSAKRYLLWMAVASALSIGRGFVVAWVLDPGAFGWYAVVASLGALGATLIGTGRIEATFKAFPRLWVEGRGLETIAASDLVAITLLWRAIAAAVIATAVSAWLGQVSWIWPVLGIGAVTLSASWSALYSSTVRATADLGSVATSTMARASTALCVGAIFAYIGSWQGAVLGEVVGALVGAVVSRTLSARHASAPTPAPERAGTSPSADGGTAHGALLFLAFSLAAVPAYLDRTLVASHFGTDTAGTYSFLMLLVTGCAAVSGIVAQKLGPQLIRMERQKASLRQQLRLLARWLSACFALVLGGVGLASAMLLVWPAQAMGTKYGLSIPLLAATSALCFLQFSVMFDWLLISRDAERQVLASAVAYLTAAALAAGATVALDLSLVAFISLLTAAKAVHLAGQCLSLVSVRRMARAGQA